MLKKNHLVRIAHTNYDGSPKAFAGGSSKIILLVALLFLGAISSLPMLGSSNTNCQSTCNDSCACPCGGKTYFFNRPMFQSYRPELWAGFRNDKMVAAADGLGGAFDIVPYAGQSTNGNNLAAYFMPNCKKSFNGA